MASANLMNSYKRVQIYLRTKGHAEMRKSMKRTPKKNYDELSRQILEEIGGKDNIINCAHCITRLRLNLKDKGLANLERIKSLSVAGVQFTGDQLQIIIGNEINEVYDAFIHTAGLEREAVVEENLDGESSRKNLTVKNIFSSVIDGIVGCVIPLLPILIASGIIKAIVLILQQAHIAAADSPTCLTLNFVADAAFYFMPVIVGGFAAKKFGANTALGAMLGASLIHPTFVSMVGEGTSLSVFGIPVYPAGYSSTIVPIILSVWVMSYIEKFISRHSPKALRSLIEPVVTLLIMIPLTFCLLAPVGAMLSTGFANALTWLYSHFGFITVALFSAAIPWVVMCGMHVGTVPIAIAAIAATGIDRLMMPCFFLSNFAQGTACLAVAIKTKDANLKSFAFTSAFSNIVPGISEPGMYGITLRYKTPMWGAMIGAAAGGLYFGITGTGSLTFLAPNIFAFAGYIGSGEYAGNFTNAVIGVIIALAVSFIATMALYKPESQ